MRRISINHPCDEPLFRCRGFRPVLKTKLGEDLPGTLEHVVGDIGQRRYGLLPVVPNDQLKATEKKGDRHVHGRTPVSVLDGDLQGCRSYAVGGGVTE
jgi:hypothetical protein